MLYLVWFFLVGSIVVMITDMMLEEWAGMDVLEGGQWLIRRFAGKSGKPAAKTSSKAISKGRSVSSSKRKR